MDLLERIRTGSYAPTADVLAVPGRGVSLALAAERIRDGAPLMAPVREFLDGTARGDPATLERLVRDEPCRTGDPRADALLAGLAEYLAVTRGFLCPFWTQSPERFLDSFWFVSAVPGFRAIAIAQTPVSLKRRGILWPERSLGRV